MISYLKYCLLGDCVILNTDGFWKTAHCSDKYFAFCRKPAHHKFCEIELDNRDNCGYDKIEEYQCINLGCCWDSPNSHCFHEWIFYYVLTSGISENCNRLFKIYLSNHFTMMVSPNKPRNFLINQFKTIKNNY